MIYILHYISVEIVVYFNKLLAYSYVYVYYALNINFIKFYHTKKKKNKYDKNMKRFYLFIFISRYKKK